MEGQINQSLIDYFVARLGHLQFAYKDEAEMREHLLSGEVTIPIPDAIKYFTEWYKSQNNQSPTP